MTDVCLSMRQQLKKISAKMCEIAFIVVLGFDQVDATARATRLQSLMRCLFTMVGYFQADEKKQSVRSGFSERCPASVASWGTQGVRVRGPGAGNHPAPLSPDRSPQRPGKAARLGKTAVPVRAEPRACASRNYAASDDQPPRLIATAHRNGNLFRGNASRCGQSRRRRSQAERIASFDLQTMTRGPTP